MLVVESINELISIFQNFTFQSLTVHVLIDVLHHQCLQLVVHSSWCHSFTASVKTDILCNRVNNVRFHKCTQNPLIVNTNFK